MDPDLRIRTPVDSTDARHETTDQKGTQPQDGAAAPHPAAYGLSPPLFQPLTAYADAAGSSLHQRGENPAPR